MRRWIATAAVALLFAEAATGDPGNAPAFDTTQQWTSIEQRIEADLAKKVDANLDRALRHHVASAEALRDIGDCDPASFARATNDVSASERQRRLSACLAQHRAAEGLVAANPGSN